MPLVNGRGSVNRWTTDEPAGRRSARAFPKHRGFACRSPCVHLAALQVFTRRPYRPPWQHDPAQGGHDLMHTKRRWTLLVAVLAIVGLLAAACGDDDDGGG